MQINSKNITRRHMLALSGAALGASTLGLSATARASSEKSNVQALLNSLKDMPAAERTGVSPRRSRQGGQGRPLRF